MIRLMRFVFFFLMSLGTVLIADRRMQFRAPVTALSFSEDGHSLLVGLSNGELSVIDIDRSVVGRTYILHSCLVTSVVKDDDMLVAGYDDGVLVIKLLRNNACATINAHKDKITVIACLASSIVSGSEDKSFCVWDKNGSLVERVLLPSAVSAIKASGDGNVLYVGCKSGSIYRYDLITHVCDEIVADLHKGPVTCLLVENQGFFAAFDSCEVVFFNFGDKSTKILRAPVQIEALEVEKEDDLVVGASCGTSSECIWDRTTGCLFDTQQYHSRVQGPVAINRLRIAYGEGSQLVLKAINYMMQDLSVVTSIDEALLDKIEIVDHQGYVSGCLKSASQDRKMHTIRLCLRSSACQKGGYVTLQDLSGAVATRYFCDPLSSIKRFLLFRGLGKGDISVGYLTSSDPGKLHHTYPGSGDSKFQFLPSPIHLALYSLNFPITQAYLTCIKNQGKHNCIRGMNTNGGQAVWFFQKEDCSGPYLLSIKSGHIVYEWQIPYISDQSELFVAKPDDRRPIIIHYSEHTQQAYKLPEARVSIAERYNKICTGEKESSWTH